MGRYTGPRTKISRRFGEPLFGPDKVLDRRTNPPGQHGARRRKKLSEYGEQLREKQKARFIYGMMERQFRTFFERAKAKQGVTGDNRLPPRPCADAPGRAPARHAPPRHAGRQDLQRPVVHREAGPGGWSSREVQGPDGRPGFPQQAPRDGELA